jgi:hypothetical protein
MTADEAEIPVEVIAAVKVGRKIDAIKLLRAHDGSSLSEAKRVIDLLMDNEPAASPNTHIKRESGVVRLILIIAIIAGVYLWLK